VSSPADALVDARQVAVDVAARLVEESPPNFSSHACASTNATIASAITPMAGTAVTSLVRRCPGVFAGGHVDRA
jgi:hypothetical protein